MPRELTKSEVDTFRAAHPELQYSTIPDNGVAIQDGTRYVLVWMDAIWRWRYIDITGATQFDELVKNKPPFVSPDGSLVDNLWRQLNVVGTAAGSTLKVIAIAAAVVAVVYVIVELAKLERS